MLSRRRFLQLATQFTAVSAALTALPRGFAFADNVHPGADDGRGIERDAPPAPLGRVTMFGADIYAAPKSGAKALRARAA